MKPVEPRLNLLNDPAVGIYLRHIVVFGLQPVTDAEIDLPHPIWLMLGPAYRLHLGRLAMGKRVGQLVDGGVL